MGESGTIAMPICLHVRLSNPGNVVSHALQFVRDCVATTEELDSIALGANVARRKSSPSLWKVDFDEGKLGR